MGLDKIPSFITSPSVAILINYVNENEIINIKNVLRTYYDDYVFDFKQTETSLEIIKRGRYLRNNKYISRLPAIGFKQNFLKTKVFDPIIINTPNKVLLSINLGILIRNLIKNQSITFDNDMDFTSLKRLFPLLKGREEYQLKKKDLDSLLFYAKKLDASKFIASERIRCGTLSGITNFRIDDCLYDIKYKNKITSKEFFKLYIYATIFNDMGIKINKVIILSARQGFEYIMTVEHNILIESTLSFYKNEKVDNLDFMTFD
jgi:hypothetical protein